MSGLLGVPEGLYKGFSYTDESPICYGEMELTVESNAIRTRMATGHHIDEHILGADQLERMDPEEVGGIFKSGAKPQKDAREGKIIGLTISSSENRNPYLLFTPGNLNISGPVSLFRRIIKADAASLLAFTFHPSWGIPPTELYGNTKEQYEAFNSKIKSLLRKRKFFPQLEHDGRMAPEYYDMISKRP